MSDLYDSLRMKIITEQIWPCLHYTFSISFRTKFKVAWFRATIEMYTFIRLRTGLNDLFCAVFTLIVCWKMYAYIQRHMTRPSILKTSSVASTAFPSLLSFSAVYQSSPRIGAVWGRTFCGRTRANANLCFLLFNQLPQTDEAICTKIMHQWQQYCLIAWLRIPIFGFAQPPWSKTYTYRLLQKCFEIFRSL